MSHPLITHDRFPLQSEAVGQMIEVRFPGDDKPVEGRIVRDDVNFPRLNRRIVQLDDGRYLLIQATTAPEVVQVYADRGGWLDETESPIFANGGYPKQDSWYRKRTEVCFQFDTRYTIMGTIVRVDDEAPHVMIIALDNGRLVLSGECQYRFKY